MQYNEKEGDSGGEEKKEKKDENGWHFWRNILVDNSQLLTISACIYLYDSTSLCLYHHPQKYYWEWKDFSEMPQSYEFDLHLPFFRRFRCSSEVLLMWSTGLTIFCSHGSNYPLSLQVSVRVNQNYYQERLLLSVSLEIFNLVISNISTIKAIAAQTTRQVCPVLWETTEAERKSVLLWLNSYQSGITVYSLVIPWVAVYNPVSKLLVEGTLKKSSPMALALWDICPESFSQIGGKKALVIWRVLAKSAH